MEIVYYPDPVLQKRADEVAVPQEGLRELVAEMLETMQAAHGVGLAAPQVGQSLRLFVASETGDPDAALVCINPEVRPFGPAVAMEEGCLSVPGTRADITRPGSVRMTWKDLDGNEHTGEFHELMARILQHEFDHLDGVLFLERMTPSDRLRVKPELDALAAQYRPR